MKVRTDFVTNSSSSSFIVGFKDGENCAETLEKMLKPEHKKYLNRIVKDIKNNRVTKTDAIRKYQHNGHLLARGEIEDQLIKKMGFREFYEWISVFENRESLSAKAYDTFMKRLDEYKNKLEEYDYIADLSYEDHVDYELEQIIMPELECVIKVFNYH